MYTQHTDSMKGGIGACLVQYILSFSELSTWYHSLCDNQMLHFVYTWTRHSHKHDATFPSPNLNVQLHIGCHPHQPGNRCFKQIKGEGDAGSILQ